MSRQPITPGTTVIDLLRHGQPEGDSCLLGSTDRALSDTGWQQLRSTTAHNPGWTQIISSPLQRCAAFARELSAQSSLPLTIDPEWRETSFGEWDGVSYDTLHQEHPEQLSAFWSDPNTNTPTGGEPLSAFRGRINQAWEALIDNSAQGHILLVTHSGVIRQVLAHILEIPTDSMVPFTRIHTPYASLCRIEVYTDEQGRHWPRLLSLGSTG
ncbi:alpha-ribazole phosphatase family protein [Parendozoicomonas haliclonae]|uniref:Alpha-ribazole phosphatase n=1 Tax=Parendozoicomonas haliclonae TaxID=1960125 RepID=A0A1X7AM65_9GAMM|nr:alpha-ribazole phosphatase family protein [Parendozoicomonas haliclonae]SMA48855.1 Alpha-ribazole phosphatase [Parendozoicomonas haliclonae]